MTRAQVIAIMAVIIRTEGGYDVEAAIAEAMQVLHLAEVASNGR